MAAVDAMSVAGENPSVVERELDGCRSGSLHDKLLAVRLGVFEPVAVYSISYRFQVTK